MPYLSWQDGGLLQRYRLHRTVLMGRDPAHCAVVPPHGQETVSRVHAELGLREGCWWVKDLGSTSGTLSNGLPLTVPLGNRLNHGDELALGDWDVRFTEGFPGLEKGRFAEGVGGLLEELEPDPGNTLLLVRGLELMREAGETLLSETDAEHLLKTLLHGCLKLFLADRGFLVMRQPDGSRRTLHRVGEVQEGVGLSRTVLDYVEQDRVAVLSNDPLADPRFPSASLLEFPRAGLMCIPMVDGDQFKGFLYLDREQGRKPFTRFDLALFGALVRQGVLALRHVGLNRQALGQAEAAGELLRVRGALERDREEHAQYLQALVRPIHWLKAWAKEAPGATSAAVRQHLDQLLDLVEEGHATLGGRPATAAGHPLKVEQLQEDLAAHLEALLQVAGLRAYWPTPPKGSAWVGGGPLMSALLGLVEPMLLTLKSGETLAMGWSQGQGTHVLRFPFPPGTPGPRPDPWTRRVLTEAGVHWRWADQVLHLEFGEGPDALPEEPERPLLGLVAKDFSLMDLFQSAAEAGDLALFPLEEQPPAPSVPRFRLLVIDANGLKDAASCIRAYRQHPSFSTTPILLVRIQEEEAAELMRLGATDWLQEGFRWEALHHRLQVLRGHQELQERALQAERLDTFRQMAGTLKHEINNPLAIISMQVEMLQRKYPDEPKLGKIGDMVDRIRDLVGVLQKMREMKLEDYADGSSIMKLG